jgi:hypothetical protein
MREKRDHQTSDRDKPKERISVQQRTRLWRLPMSRIARLFELNM